MFRILIVEDEAAMLQGLRDNLELEGYIVEGANNGKDGLEKIRNNPYHLVLLDVMLPGISGFEVCKTIRQEQIQTPIILLTAKSEEIDKVLGLELGADDYITKPFSLRELLARIKAVLRRYNKPSQENVQEIYFGKLRVNFASCTAFSGNEEQKMSHKELEFLQYLYKHKNQVVNRNELMDKVWGTDVTVNSRTIDNFVVKLRQKIETNHNEPKIILTVHGVGYKLIVND